VLIEGAEEFVPRVMSGVRLIFSAIFTFVRTVLAWALIGLLGGAGYSVVTGDDMAWAVPNAMAVTVIIGVLLGVILAIRVLARGATARRR
jgi:hypothetical protein